MRQLHSAASYNDKGFIWMSHSKDKSAELRKEFQTRLQDLAKLSTKLLACRRELSDRRQTMTVVEEGLL